LPLGEEKKSINVHNHMSSGSRANDGLGVVRIKPLGAGLGGVEQSAHSDDPDLLPPVLFDCTQVRDGERASDERSDCDERKLKLQCYGN